MPERAFHSAAASVLFLGLAALAAAPAAAAEDLPFRRPAGWMPEAAASSSLQQVGRDFEKGHASILASGPLSRNEGLEASLARVLAKLPGRVSPPTGRGAGVTALGQQLVFERWDGVAGVLEAVVLDDGDRRVALLLQGKALAPRHALLARDAFDAAVRSVQPARDLAPLVAPLVAPEAAGGLEGAFTGLRFDRRPNGEGDTEVRAEIWVLFFDPSGLFSRVVPSAEGGVPAHCRARPADCGTFGLLGGGWLRRPDRIRLRDGSGRYGQVETRELPFKRRDAALVIDGTPLTPAAVQPRGARLHGTWTGGAFSAEVSVERQLTFEADGRFRRVVETNNFRQDKGISSTTGFYQLEGYKLVLQGDDGARESHGLLQPDPGSDSVLFIDGEAYLKRAPDRAATE